MSLPARLACLELAETILEQEFARTGTDPSTSPRALALATAIQEAIEAWSRSQADDEAFDREARRRPNEPPEPFDPDPKAWESRCYGNTTMNASGPVEEIGARLAVRLVQPLARPAERAPMIRQRRPR